ncbi:TIGR02611 family protein [Microbacterium sp. NPDC076911]|uniref:TIGR02611 family protein n=1 Tax=Microbacterium sp. NPDC076911 TaxID=3154958 RepID=UPI00343791CD
MTHESLAIERSIRADIAAAERSDRPVRQLMRSARGWIAEHPRLEFAYRVAVAVAGSVLAVAGLILVPLPGPGWLVVFLGLAVLGTEFYWAHRIALWLKSTLDRFWQWWKQRRALRAARRTRA